MKKFLSLLVALFAFVSMCACGYLYSELGVVQKYANSGEFTVNEIEEYTREELALKGQSALAFELSGDEGVVLIYFTMRNTGKSDFTVDADKVTVYSSAVEYHTKRLWHKTGDNEYEPCPHGFALEKISHEAECFVAAVPVPLSAIEDTANPVKVEVYNKIFKLR